MGPCCSCCQKADAWFQNREESAEMGQEGYRMHASFPYAEGQDVHKVVMIDKSLRKKKEQLENEGSSWEK